MKNKYYVFEQASGQTGYIATIGRTDCEGDLSDFKTPEGDYEKLTFYDDIDSACDYLDKRTDNDELYTYFRQVQEPWRIAYNPNMVETERDKKRLERMGFASFEDRIKGIEWLRGRPTKLTSFLPYKVTIEHDDTRDIATIGIDTDCYERHKQARRPNYLHGLVCDNELAYFGSKREAQTFINNTCRETGLKVIDTTLPEYDPAQKIIEKEQPASVFEQEAMGLENVVTVTTKTTKTSKAKKKIDNTPDFIDTSDIKENGNDHIKEAGE